MKLKLTLSLLLLTVGLFNGYAQSKEETIQTINSILSKSIGGTDSLQFGVYRKLGKITENRIEVDKTGLVHHYLNIDFGGQQNTKNDRTSMASDWKEFKQPTTFDGSLKHYYKVIPKRAGQQFDDARLGDRFHYTNAVEGEKMLAALKRLQQLYSESK